MKSQTTVDIILDLGLIRNCPRWTSSSISSFLSSCCTFSSTSFISFARQLFSRNSVDMNFPRGLPHRSSASSRFFLPLLCSLEAPPGVHLSMDQIIALRVHSHCTLRSLPRAVSETCLSFTTTTLLLLVTVLVSGCTRSRLVLRRRG